MNNNDRDMVTILQLARKNAIKTYKSMISKPIDPSRRKKGKKGIDPEKFVQQPLGLFFTTGLIFCLVLGRAAIVMQSGHFCRVSSRYGLTDNKADLFMSPAVKSYCFCLAGHAENHPIGAHTWVCTHGPGTTHWSSQANGF